MQAKRPYSLFTLLLKRLLLAFVIFTLCRLTYFVYNVDYFPSDFWGILSSFFAGLIFDASTIAYLFAPFTLLSLLPFAFQKRTGYQHFLRILFLITTAAVVIANLADAIYFKFSRKRSGIEIFSMLGDESNPVGSYFVTYWPWLLIIVGIILITLYFYVFGIPDLVKSKRKWWFYLVVLIAVAMAGRGSFGLKPLRTFDAARFVPAAFVPLTVNTPFNLMSTLQGTTLDKIEYFSDSSTQEILNPERFYFSSKRPPNQPNIVILILESFSRDYCGYLMDTTLYTPFLDSLSKKSMYFTNAYANGNISIHGLPAIMAGIPNFMEVPYINSSYQNNKITNVGGLLSRINYQSHFYHGADNGTMGFQNFLKITGWQNYNGKNQYPDFEKNYDGSWGVFDGPYFQHFANELNSKKEPFLASVFSLSSHEPYPLPKGFKNRYKPGTRKIHTNIQYTDEMLKEFFAQAKKEKWFKNTVFILTADHTSHSTAKYFYSSTGEYEIPIIIYDPSQQYVKPGANSKTVSQIDILPTVMDIVNYPYPFFSLGSSMLDPNSGFAFQRKNGVYQVISYPYVAQMKPNGKFVFFKNYKSNIQKFYGLFPEEYAIRKEMLKRLLAFIQQHNNHMIDNSFNLEE